MKLASRIDNLIFMSYLYVDKQTIKKHFFLEK